MTTFGGHTIPPIFQGGAAAPAGNIFLRSTGDWLNSAVDGVAQQNIPQAPTINAGDDLYVIEDGLAAGPVNAAAWTSVFTTGLGGVFRCYRRRATGDANDVYTMPAHTGLVVSKMACFGNLNQPTLDELVPFQGGFVNSDTDTTWTVDGMSANTTQDPFAAVMLFAARNAGVLGSTPSVDGSLLPQIIGQIAVSQAGEGSRWVSWEFDNQQPSVSYPNFIDLPYSPSPTNAVQWTQYQRFGLF